MMKDIVESICWMVVIVALIAGFLGIDIRITVKHKCDCHKREL